MKMRVTYITFLLMLLLIVGVNAQKDDQYYITSFAINDDYEIIWVTHIVESNSVFANGRLYYYDALMGEEVTNLIAIKLIMEDIEFESIHSDLKISFLRLQEQDSNSDIEVEDLLPEQLKEELREQNISISFLQKGQLFGLVDYRESCLISGIHFAVSDKSIKGIIDCNSKRKREVDTLPLMVSIISDFKTQDVLYKTKLIPSSDLKHELSFNLENYQNGSYLLKFRLGKDAKYYVIEL